MKYCKYIAKLLIDIGVGKKTIIKYCDILIKTYTYGEWDIMLYY